MLPCEGLFLNADCFVESWTVGLSFIKYNGSRWHCACAAQSTKNTFKQSVFPVFVTLLLVIIHRPGTGQLQSFTTGQCQHWKNPAPEWSHRNYFSKLTLHSRNLFLFIRFKWWISICWVFFYIFLSDIIVKACCLIYCIIFISKLQLINTLHSYLTFTQERKFYFDYLNSPETGSNPVYLRLVSFPLLAVKQRVLTGQDGCQFFSLLQCCTASCGSSL